MPIVNEKVTLKAKKRHDEWLDSELKTACMVCNAPLTITRRWMVSDNVSLSALSYLKESEILANIICDQCSPKEEILPPKKKWWQFWKRN